MIKINLVPEEELDNPYWWISDVLVILAVACVAYAGVHFYLNVTQEKIDKLMLERDALRASVAQLQPDVKRHAELKSKVDDLNNKLQGLQAITQSKIRRYRPVIVLDLPETDDRLGDRPGDGGLDTDRMAIDRLVARSARVAHA